jgi:hypothetical protein
MQCFGPKVTCVCAVVTMMLGACAQQAPVMRPPPASIVKMIEPEMEAISSEIEPDVTKLMADVKGDKALPELNGEIEQIDCKSGVEDLQARIAIEAHGGQIESFAYYSKWRPRTCSLEIQRHDPDTKWRLTADGATRVQTPHGMFLIRVRSDAYVFEFQNVERQKFCGMTGYTNGTMTIKRRSSKPECSVTGLLDRDGEFYPVSKPERHSVAASK